MAHGSLAGRAHVSLSNPEAQAECDRCRFWYNRSKLRWQYQWSGARLINTGFLVCGKCLDIPFDQYRVLILPGDPIPVRDARPSPDVTAPAFAGLSPPTDPYNQGFTPFALGGVPPAAAPWQGVAGTPSPDGFPPGFPMTKRAVLAATAAVTGIPIPGLLVDASITFTKASATQRLLSASAARSWLLMYSPVAPMSGFSLGSAILGSPATLMFGPGMAWFSANAQGLGNTYAGAVTAVGLQAGMPLWTWQSSSEFAQWLDPQGNLMFDPQGNPMFGPPLPSGQLTDPEGNPMVDPQGNPMFGP
jgi:hypothetical protein